MSCLQQSAQQHHFLNNSLLRLCCPSHVAFSIWSTISDLFLRDIFSSFVLRRAIIHLWILQHGTNLHPQAKEVYRCCLKGLARQPLWIGLGASGHPSKDHRNGHTCLSCWVCCRMQHKKGPRKMWSSFLVRFGVTASAVQTEQEQAKPVHWCGCHSLMPKRWVFSLPGF